MKQEQFPSLIATELLRQFNHVPILDLEEFLEFLEDYNLLNPKGLRFRKHLWECFIKERKRKK